MNYVYSQKALGRAKVGMNIIIEETKIFPNFSEVMYLAADFPNLVELSFPGLNSQIDKLTKCISFLLDSNYPLKLRTLDGSVCQWVKHDTESQVKKYFCVFSKS